MADMALIGEGAGPEGVFPLDKMIGGGFGIAANIGGRSQVLPVGRLGNGNLGIQMRGLARGDTVGDMAFSRFNGSENSQGGPGNSFTDGRTSIRMTVVAKDADSFKRNKRQITSSLRKEMSSGVS